MNPRARQVLLIVLFIGSVIGIAAALYFVFFRPPQAPTTTPPTTTTTPSQPSGTLPGSTSATPTTPGQTGTGALPPASPVANGGVTQITTLTTAPVEGVSLNSNGSSVNYYDPTDGHFYSIDASGNVHQLSAQAFPDATAIAWNKTGTEAAITFPAGPSVVYDFSTQKQYSLPANWQDIQFSPVQNQIIAENMAIDSANNWLVTANSDGTDAKAIQALGDNADQVTVAWSPNNQIVAFSSTGGALGTDSQLVIPIGTNQENFQGLTVEGTDFEPNWSPDGSQLLYSAAGSINQNKPLLWITDASPSTLDQDRHSIGLNTWADKCTFADETTLYCAVPTSLPDYAGLQPSLFATNPDQLYKVDTATGATSLVAIPSQDTSMTNLTVSADQSSLYYTDASTGLLNVIKLK